MSAALQQPSSSVREEDALAQACHKLRTPLTAALGYVQLAQRDAGRDTADELRRKLSLVEEQLRRIAAIIDQLAGTSQSR
ncbi:MAG TPA: histidine kinase dimerization/phospho-acceptor domain-containing protein [Chloroflexota bacterium]